MTIYDAQTASGVDAEGQIYPWLNSMNNLHFNEDGSVTLDVGPQPPADSHNWLKTVPGDFIKV